MCGIFGEFNFNTSNLEFKKSWQKLNLIKHRGPDGFGYEAGIFGENLHFVDHCRNGGQEKAPICPLMNINYFLGHRRLSIIDLNDNAFQPMESISKRYSIVFNGEIYNYLELKYELLKVGIKFSIGSYGVHSL